MPSLTLDPFASLIRLLPVNQHSVRVKASNWEDAFLQYGLEEEFGAIFGEFSEISLRREEVRNRCHEEERRKCIEILLWGYPSGMRGNHHLDYLENIERIVECAKSEELWPDYYAALNDLKNLGISTVTKIAYFFDRRFDGQQALILDNRIISVVSRGGWDELAHLRVLTYGNSVGQYLSYLRTSSELAARIEGAQPDQIEFFLFALGGAFETNVD